VVEQADTTKSGWLAVQGAAAVLMAMRVEQEQADKALQAVPEQITEVPIVQVVVAELLLLVQTRLLVLLVLAELGHQILHLEQPLHTQAEAAAVLITAVARLAVQVAAVQGAILGSGLRGLQILVLVAGAVVAILEEQAVRAAQA
jgi:hypothetical protein